MNESGPFTRQLVTALAGSMLAAFALCLFLFVSGAGQGRTVDDTVGANSESISAIGHAGFHELLRRSGFTVARGGTASADQVGANGVLIIAEPEFDRISTDGFRLKQAPSLLVILPKWAASPDRQHSGWIAVAGLLPTAIPQGIAGLLDGAAEIVRVARPLQWTSDRLGSTPTIDGELQLIRSGRMKPVLGNADGMLVGEMEDHGRRIFVLADPDPIENHGLLAGNNAAFSLALIRALSTDGPAIFDETVHGLHEAPANPLGLLFRFPAVLATIQVFIAVLLLLAATMTRFGRPFVVPARLTFGKDSLIRNAAALLDHGGHHATILRRYGHVVLNEAGRQLHAPPIPDDQALAAWLDRVGAARGATGSAVEILARIDGGRERQTLAELFVAARDMHRFKGELLDGS